MLFSAILLRPRRTQRRWWLKLLAQWYNVLFDMPSFWVANRLISINKQFGVLSRFHRVVPLRILCGLLTIWFHRFKFANANLFLSLMHFYSLLRSFALEIIVVNRLIVKNWDSLETFRRLFVIFLGKLKIMVEFSRIKGRRKVLYH